MGAKPRVTGDEFTISLNRNFYDLGSIRKSLRDFSGVCSGRVLCRRSFDVVIRPLGGGDAERIAHEFCNYVLAMMKNENKV